MLYEVITPQWAEVIDSRCIGCGKCVKVCSQQAKVIADSISVTKKFLAAGDDVVAVLGCSYPAFFNDVRPGQLASALKRLGFAEVHEGASGVDLIRNRYIHRINEKTDTPLIATHCPTIVV